jgi:glucose dehydrogenase
MSVVASAGLTLGIPSKFCKRTQDSRRQRPAAGLFSLYFTCPEGTTMSAKPRPFTYESTTPDSRGLARLSASLVAAAFWALGLACVDAGAAPPIAKGGPDSQALLRAGQNDAEWILPGKTYGNNRHTALKQINRDNVASLGLAWSTQTIDDGQQEASPIVSRGTMYVSTPHDGVLALDAANGKLKWQFAYNPAYIIISAVSRGVGIADGKVYIVTQDCRLIALDADTGKQV